MKLLNYLVLLAAISIGVAGCSGGGSSTVPGIASPNRPITRNEDLTQGLKGTDANDNGIRDDIDRLIATKYSAKPEVMRAVQQHAIALQQFLEVTNKDQARLAAHQISRSVGCIFKMFPKSTPEEIEFREKALKEIEALVSNTRERFTKYWNSNGMVGGMIIPSAKEPLCD